MTQITTSERIRIFAAYWGAEMSSMISNTEGIHGKFVGMEIDRCYMLMSDNKTQAWAFLSNCSLLLRNISALTDAEAIEVAKMLSYHPDICDVWDDIKDDFDASDVVRHEGCIEVLFTHVCFIGSIRIYHDLRIYTHDEDGEEINTGTWGISPAVADYLRSLSINIGYSTHSAHDLIDAGIVVESKL